MLPLHLSFQHFFIGIFGVANNFSALGLFLGLCAGLERKQRLKLCMIASSAAFCVMMVAMLGGGLLLEFFGISIEAFRIAGGLILCVSGMGMVNAKPPAQADTTPEKRDFSSLVSAAVIPITIPLTTGPGTFSMITIFMDQIRGEHLQQFMLFLAILACTGSIYLIFRYSMKLYTLLGHTGMNVLVKTMGIIMLAIGVQFIIYGLKSTFPALHV